MRYAFYLDQTRCMCCNACTVACKDWNQVNPGPVRWRKADTYELNDSFFPFSMSCNHCEEPACQAACTAGAIEKTETGIVYVDKEKCQGIQACITACPFAAPHIADDKQEPEKKSAWIINHPMQKCDMCMERVNKAQRPVCVAACPAHALDFGDYDMLRSKYADAEPLNPTKYPYAYANNTTETGPSYLIKPRLPLTVVKAKSQDSNLRGCVCTPA